VVYLIATFVQLAGVLVLLGINFVGISYIVVYVGKTVVNNLFILIYAIGFLVYSVFQTILPVATQVYHLFILSKIKVVSLPQIQSFLISKSFFNFVHLSLIRILLKYIIITILLSISVYFNYILLGLIILFSFILYFYLKNSKPRSLYSKGKFSNYLNKKIEIIMQNKYTVLLITYIRKIITLLPGIALNATPFSLDGDGDTQMSEDKPITNESETKNKEEEIKKDEPKTPEKSNSNKDNDKTQTPEKSNSNKDNDKTQSSAPNPEIIHPLIKLEEVVIPEYDPSDFETTRNSDDSEAGSEDEGGYISDGSSGSSDSDSPKRLSPIAEENESELSDTESNNNNTYKDKLSNTEDSQMESDPGTPASSSGSSTSDGAFSALTSSTEGKIYSPNDSVTDESNSDSEMKSEVESEDESEMESDNKESASSSTKDKGKGKETEPAPQEGTKNFAKYYQNNERGLIDHCLAKHGKNINEAELNDLKEAIAASKEEYNMHEDELNDLRAAIAASKEESNKIHTENTEKGEGSSQSQSQGQEKGKGKGKERATDES
jgi:NADH:ubiquinone oxidoreductase subunit 6 (subunit J)